MTDPIDAPVSRLVIDLDALIRNWQALARMVRPAECAGIVKADAYGLGAAQVLPRRPAGLTPERQPA